MVGWAFDEGRARELNATQRYVLVAYADNSTDAGKCWPSKGEIIDKTGLSQATVYRAIGVLEEQGLLRQSTDERGRECVWLGSLADSHSEKTAAGDSHHENGNSHSEKPYIEEPSKEPSQGGSGKKSKRTSSPHPVDLVFAAWVQSTDRTARTQLTPERRRLIKRAFGWGYSAEDLVAAVQGWRHSPHHLGENDRRTVYNDLGLLLRDADRIERFRDLELQHRAGADGCAGGTGRVGAQLVERRRRKQAEAEAPQEEAA
jgi:DNA-binding transcriptional ArsR family regulator